MCSRNQYCGTQKAQQIRKVNIRKWIDLLLFSNIFISLCAAAMTAETYVIIHSGIDRVYIAFVFSSTLALYNFPVLITSNFSRENSGRHHWVRVNRKLLVVLCVAGSAASAVLTFFFPLRFILWFIPIGLLALAYFFPQTRLRGITTLKTGVVAFVWACMTAVFPLLLVSDFQLPHSVIAGDGTVLLQNFLFILPLCLIFNVRDIGADREAGIRTMPILYGVPITVMVCTVFFALFAALVISAPSLWEFRNALVISGVLSAGLIMFASTKRGEYYYSLWVDGMILLQAAGVFLLN